MPRGGKRPGAGRPKGAKNVLPQGAVAAMKAAGLRVPSDAPKAHRELADRALCRIADVMEEKANPFTAFAVLQASRLIREEVCGPVPKRHEVTGRDGGPLVVEVINYADTGQAPESVQPAGLSASAAEVP